MRKPYWFVADGVINIASTKQSLASALGVEVADILAADVTGQPFVVGGVVINHSALPEKRQKSGRLTRAERADMPLIPHLVTHRLGVYR